MKRKWKVVLLLIIVVSILIVSVASYEIGKSMRIPAGGRIVFP